MKRIAFVLLAVVCMQACKLDVNCNISVGNFYKPRYAKGFCIDTMNGVKILTVFNPFQNTENTAYCYGLDSVLPQRVVCMSTTHIALLNFINKTSTIVGVSGTEHIYDSLMQAECRAGRIAEVGYDTRLNVEKLLALHPDLIFAYGVSGEFSAVADKLAEVGLRVVYIGEYTEQHPLGKAEWAVAMAAFWNCESEAASKFAQVEAAYMDMKKLVVEAPVVEVLFNAPWGDAWYLPGAQGYAARLLHDAGGASVIPLRQHRDSYPISIERACQHALQAKVWLNPGQAKSLQELSAMHKLVAEIPAFRSGEVYNNNARLSPHGGSDFFESGTVNPHLILKDIIKILHPDLLPDYAMTYYRKLD